MCGRFCTDKYGLTESEKKLIKGFGMEFTHMPMVLILFANGAIIVMKYFDVIDVITETSYLLFFSMDQILLYSGVLI